MKLGHGLELQPVRPIHYDALRIAEIDASGNGGWRLAGSTPAPEDYPRTLWAGVLAQYLVCSTSTDRVFGLVSAYDHNAASRVVSLAAMKFAGRSPANPLMLGAAHFVDHLFASFDLRKIKMETPVWNLAHLGGMVRHGIAVEEGRFVDEYFARGRYWDIVLLAIWRAAWNERKGMVLGDCSGPQ